MDNPPVSILLIDEDLRSRTFLGGLLARQKYAVQTAPSGKEGYISVLRDKPDVIIIDCGIRDISAVELVKKLRSDKRSSAIICIALAQASDSAQMSAMLAAGSNEFFVKTHESIEKLLAMLADVSGVQGHAPLVVGQKKTRAGGLLAVFLSAKGGLGTSSLCVNIAQNLAVTSPELDIGVMDLVLPIGSLAAMVGYHGEFDLFAAASASPKDLSIGGLRSALKLLENWHFRLMPGASDPEVASALDMKRAFELATLFRQAFDLTFIDLGCSISAASLPIIQEADVVVFVTGSDLATVNLTQTAWQYLKRKGIEPSHVYMLLNRATGLEGLSKSDAERILGVQIRAATPYLGSTFALANNQHLPIMVKLPNDTAAMMLDQISREVLETARRNRA